MAILRSIQKRGDRKLITKETPAEKLRKKRQSDAYNIDNVVSATPLTINTEPVPVVQPINLVSQNPSEPNKLTDEQLKSLETQQPVTDIQNTTNQNELASTLAKQKTDLEKEIETLSRSLANLPEATISAKNKLGINEDQKRLDTLRGDLSKVKQNLLTSQDASVSIGEKGLQRVSDFAGTSGDYGNLTNEALRQNRLDQLVQGRNLSRIGDTIGNLQASINNNISSINENAKAEQAKIEFDIGQKNAILDRVIKTQGNILSSKQKAQLEVVKHKNELELADRKAQADQKASLLTSLAKDKNVSSADLAKYAGMNYADISDDLASKSPANATSWLSYTPEEAIVHLDKDQYSRWQQYNKLDDASLKKKAQQEAIVSATDDSISLINSMLDNQSGMDDSVGTLGSNRNYWPGNQADVNKFRTDLTSLSSLITLNTLKNLKASGATLGAISEKELHILQTAATRLGLITDSDGKAVGRSNLSEQDFKNRLKEIQAAALKVNIANNIGIENAIKYDIKNKSPEALSIFYNDMKNGTLPEQKAETGNVDMGKISALESGGSYTAVNPTTGAYGKYQFLPSTLSEYANKIGITKEEARTPQGQEKIFKALTADNQNGLKKANIPVNTATTYLAHQQGLNGAKQIIEGKISPTVRRNILANIPARYQNASDQDVIQGWFDTYLPKLT